MATVLQARPETASQDLTAEMTAIGIAARKAAHVLSTASAESKRAALLGAAAAIREATPARC
jgi:hypothetical protein